MEHQAYNSDAERFRAADTHPVAKGRPLISGVGHRGRVLCETHTPQNQTKPPFAPRYGVRCTYKRMRHRTYS